MYLQLFLSSGSFVVVLEFSNDVMIGVKKREWGNSGVIIRKEGEKP